MERTLPSGGRLLRGRTPSFPQPDSGSLRNRDRQLTSQERNENSAERDERLGEGRGTIVAQTNPSGDTSNVTFGEHGSCDLT